MGDPGVEGREQDGVLARGQAWRSARMPTWKLITVLLSDGKTPEARQVLAWYKPGPGSQDEIRLWMHLHLASRSRRTTRVMIGLAQRQPDGELCRSRPVPYPGVGSPM
jgi:hypothetical protein